MILIFYEIIKMNYFLCKSNLSLMKYENISDSGNCYLVSDVKTNERYWLMYYDLYKLVENNNNTKWNYNEEYDKELRKLLSSL